ncbi:MAG: UvrD-helicase domain-containing protein [Anaeromyxobacter sp.]
MTPRPDEVERDRAVEERDRNVLVDAGAGTGKTTLLVRRVLELVAPTKGGAPVPLGRIAAITFTRKAAGELKFRIREALLRALSTPGVGEPRAAQLRDALAALDTAWVGTIHGFADRLLRMRPVESGLSPSYEIFEDDALLHDETYDLVMQAIDLGTLAAELDGLVPAPLAREAEATLVAALKADVRPETREHAYGEYVGLDALFRRFVETRDVPPVVAPPAAPDLGRFRDLVKEWRALAGGVRGAAEGHRWLARSVRTLDALARAEDPAEILRGLNQLRASAPKRPTKGVTFADDPAAWRAWKAWLGDTGKKAARASSMRDDLLAPFASWLARRLVRCAPVVVAAHERVKRRHGAVDQVDLLLKLRDLLRSRPDVRAELQGLFAQIMVDEFQDTDPLQAEIVLYLCERGAAATGWRDVELTPGKLTIVGDPKQSIYRFRRADIEVYAGVRALVHGGGALEASLRSNFRCAPRLIEWLNDRFDGILGRAPEGESVFDPAEGTVANVALVAGREGGDAPAVAVLPLSPHGEDETVDTYRATEARALATFLRRLVDRRREIVDPITRQPRPLRFGDVAILTAATTKLPLLFPELDRLGIPYAVRGSRLFLEDPLHRQFLLALRRLADRDDGVGEAALLRAPFFAVDLDDLARAKAAPPDSTLPGVLRVRQARAFVADLRERRDRRPPGETARDLLEHTGFARAVALGVNGEQRLASLRELCLRLDAVAAEEHLDFDGATQLLRTWVESPIELDPPRPLGDGALQILSIHQAKGLEYPVVCLWDSCAKLTAREQSSPFAVDRDGTSWAVKLDGLEWSEPDGEFAEREQRYRNAERLRLVYVAATRARDLLVLPAARTVDGTVNGRLVEGAASKLVDPLEPFALGEPPAWAQGVAAPERPKPGDAAPLAAEVAARWTAASAAAGAPRLAPSSVTAEAHREPEPEAEEETRAPKILRRSRHGPVFGDAVHRAIGVALAAPALSPAGAVARAALATGLDALHAEAAADVARALAALEAAGLRRAPGADLRLEYPIALATPDEAKLVQGYVDLVGVRAATGRLAVVDFKTDQPPGPGERVEDTHAAYVAQVLAYARALEALGLAPAGSIEAGLLFTADGVFRRV